MTAWTFTWDFRRTIEECDSDDNPAWAEWAVEARLDGATFSAPGKPAVLLDRAQAEALCDALDIDVEELERQEAERPCSTPHDNAACEAAHMAREAA